jgi:hypothetical protein
MSGAASRNTLADDGKLLILRHIDATIAAA